MAQISKNILAALLILTIVVSVFGTINAMNSLSNYQQIPLSGTDDLSQSSAEVTVYVKPPPKAPPSPVSITGEVFVNLVEPSNIGG